MDKFEKECINIDYLLERDKLIRFLLSYDISYTLYDVKKIQKLQKKLLYYLEKGHIYDKEN